MKAHSLGWPFAVFLAVAAGANGPASVGAPAGASGSAVLAEWGLGSGRDVPTWVANASACSVVTRQGRRCLEIVPDRDPYTRVEWEFRLPAMPALAGQTVVLEVGFMDEGAGLIEPRWQVSEVFEGTWTSPTRRSSFTRLNTGQPRRAWFQFTVPKSAAGVGQPTRLRVAGLQYLRSLRLLEAQTEDAWVTVAAAVPKHVRPMVELQRPMELVTTAGIDVTGDMSALPASLAALNDLAPLARVLGFTAIESYVTWKRLEPRREGEFDFSFYDAVTSRLAEYDLKWFPLLIVGSAYALPDWFLDGPENHGFVCLEHGLTNAIQSIWAPTHRRHVTRVLQAFGRHYEPLGVLEGVRLGPSGNYGESQYPAGGSWGARGEPMHIHIGWWAADRFGRGDFRRWLARKYAAPAALAKAWDADLTRFDDVEPLLPGILRSKRRRLDFTAWYTDSMSDWCAWWAEEARRAMPQTRIYQSAGGWGFREAGTDYSAQTKAMRAIDGGVRLTNETDSYEQNNEVTRLAITAARHYGVRLGFEPASSHTARGVAGRIFHTASANGDHLFTYEGNLFSHQLSIARWLECLPFLDTRQTPVIEVAVYYPEIENQLGDGAFRHLYAWGFYPLAREVRRVIDVDYLDDRLIRDGFLDHYRVLVFAWGNHLEADVQARVDAWLRRGGTILYPSFPRGPQQTIEGATSRFQQWSIGDTGLGSFHRYRGDMEPPSGYGDFVASVLAKLPNLDPRTRRALAVQHPPQVFLTVQEDGHVLALNYQDTPARLALKDRFDAELPPYGLARFSLDTPLP